MTHPPVFRRAKRIESLEISEIVQLTERAVSLRAEGKDVIALTTGEPDFPTPPHIIEAAHQAGLAGFLFHLSPRLAENSGEWD